MNSTKQSRFLRDNWVIVGIAVLVVVGMVTILFKNAQAEKTAAAEKVAAIARAKATQEQATQARVAREAAEAATYQQLCVDGIKALLAEASSMISKGEFRTASVRLQRCTQISSSAKDLYDKAERLDDQRKAALIAEVSRAEKSAKKKAGVSIGMSEQDVLDSSWGRPEKINRTTTATTVREQWVYRSHGSYLYFVNGVLQTIQN